MNKSISDNGYFDFPAFEEELLSFVEKNAESNAFIVFDKLSILQSLGISIKEILRLTRALQIRVQKYKCVLITRCRGISKEDTNFEEPSNIVSNILSHSASLNIFVSPLHTGKSANVSGNLSFLWATEKSWSRYQFRIEEKDVRIFAKGTSSAVL